MEDTTNDKRKRLIITYWSEEDAAWVSEIPSLEGCAADGETPEESVREVMIAYEGHMEARAANGMTMEATHE